MVDAQTTDDLTALVQARLAPLHTISSDERLADWLPCLQVSTYATEAGRHVTVICWHTGRRKAEEGAEAIFRLLNGWYPPGPWHRLTARICGSCEPAGLGRAWARVDAETRWEGGA